MSATPDEPEPFAPLERLRSERIYASPWCGLRRDTLRLPAGGECEHHVIEIGDAVVVVPVLADGSLVLIAQYRYPHGRTHWEAPAGRLQEGEQPAQAAARELREETGYRPGRLVPLPGFHPINGISAHWAHAFLALECQREGEPTPDEQERLRVEVVSRERAEALLDAGRFRDGFTALALLYWLRLGAPA